ncbi:MAG: hypothetical protein A4S09_05420 [Proteobacteria bacterium SG_bin7]|nr:MAG: hypothetical protein A4S09_05420 [Proteobacteria bacterium SG_bin7]
MKLKLTVTVSFLICAILACETNPYGKSPDWGNRMQELSKTLANLLPFVMSRDDFNKEKNLKFIDENVKNMMELAHAITVKSSEDSPEADPSIKSLAKNFEIDMAKAYDGLQTGHREYSRQVLAMATNHCVACHSRSQMGPKLESLSANIDYQSLSPFVRAEVYASTRQFNLAIDEYNKIIHVRENIVEIPFEVERALKKVLALEVRVFNDPKKALLLMNDFLSQTDLPHFLRREATIWRDDLMAWEKENHSKKMNKIDYKKNIEKLILSAQLKNTSGERDEPFINYLRATALGHEYLNKFKSDAMYSEILLNMGICYESLQDLGYWTLSEDYYKQCIRETPHTDIALRCYNRLEQSIYLGYTGSAGTRLPPDIRTELKSFKELASIVPR